MTHTITVQDGTGDTTVPDAITGVSSEIESGNEIHRMIAPGTIAVTLVGDLPRSGTLTLRYFTDDAAEAARELLGRPAAFSLSSTSRSVIDMEFVRSGRMSPVMMNGFVGMWEFQVGFQEVPG